MEAPLIRMQSPSEALAEEALHAEGGSAAGAGTPELEVM